MKLTVYQDLSIPEPEIIVRCAGIDAQLQRLIEKIRQYGFSLTGYQENREFHLALDSVCFIDSVDGKTFLYQEKEVYQSRETLAALENKLSKTPFVRVSKNCIINTEFLDHVEPLFNHRLKGVLKNGESLIITRSYMEQLKSKLKGAQV